MSAVLDYITNMLKERQAVGLERYGVSIDDCDPPTGCFKLEVIEEQADGLQYMARECMKKEKEIERLRQHIKDLEIKLENEQESDNNIPSEQ